MAHPHVFTYPGRQQAVATAAVGWRGIESGPTPIRRGRSVADVGMRSGGMGAERNPYKTHTGMKKQGILTPRKIR